MTQSIKAYFFFIPVLPAKTFHEAIVYDKGDGTTPTVIQGFWEPKERV